jgi:hypothetical protein
VCCYRRLVCGEGFYVQSQRSRIAATYGLGCIVVDDQ